MTEPTEDQFFWLAESSEPAFDYVDPVFKAGKFEVTFHVIVEGVFSTFAKAEDALNMRVARMRGVDILNEFHTSSTESSTRDVLWREGRAAEPRHGDQTCWQQIHRIRIDAHTS